MALVSCKQEVIINIEDRPSVLVVDAPLYPDSVFCVNLSRTQNITDNSGKKYVEDAIIEVFDKDTAIVDVLLHSGKGTYKSSGTKPEPGQLYLFKIGYQNRSFWASERMPDTMECVIQDTSRIIFQGKNNFFQFNVRLTDPITQSNFYGISVKRYYNQINGTDTQALVEWSRLETVDLILTEDPQTRFSNKHLVFKDVYFNGSTQYLKFGIADLFSNPAQVTTALELSVASYTENAFNYYSSVNEHLFYQNDPFSQPAVIRGNVNGAYGCIVASYQQRFLLKLK
jgi:hypothetical protein